MTDSKYVGEGIVACYKTTTILVSRETETFTQRTSFRQPTLGSRLCKYEVLTL